MIGWKVMTQNANISISFFLRFCTKTDICIFFVFYILVFFVITFVPIKIQTCSAPQNDRRNLSFVKDEHRYGEKKARKVVLRSFIKGHSFRNSLYKTKNGKYTGYIPLYQRQPAEWGKCLLKSYCSIPKICWYFLT